MVELYDIEVDIDNKIHHYRRKIKQEGNKVYIDHYYRTKKSYINSMQFDQYTADSKRIEKLLTYWVYWQKPSYKRLKSRLDRLKDLINNDEK